MNKLWLLIGLFYYMFASSVWAACSLSVQPVLFGNYDFLESLPLDSAGLVEVTCDTVLDTYSVSLSTGAGSYAQRKMNSGVYTLNYNIYVDAGRTLVWGDGSGGTNLINGSGLFTSFSAYGRVTAQQNARVGNYNDNLITTITF